MPIGPAMARRKRFGFGAHQRGFASAPFIRRPTASSVASARSRIFNMRPRNITAIRSDSEKISESSEEIRRIAQPRSAAARIWACTNSAAPTSSPRVGWATMSAAGRFLHLARDHHFLHVAAGELADRQRRPSRRARRYCRIFSSAKASRAAMRMSPAAPIKPFQAIVAGSDILRDRHRRAEPTVKPILGDEAEAEAAARLRACGPDFGAVEHD